MTHLRNHAGFGCSSQSPEAEDVGRTARLTCLFRANRNDRLSAANVRVAEHKLLGPPLGQVKSIEAPKGPVIGFSGSFSVTQGPRNAAGTTLGSRPPAVGGLAALRDQCRPPGGPGAHYRPSALNSPGGPRPLSNDCGNP